MHNWQGFQMVFNNYFEPLLQLSHTFGVIHPREGRIFPFSINQISLQPIYQMNPKERIILFLLAALNFTNILDFMIMMPLGNFLMPHFKIGAQYFSVIVAAYPIASFVSSIIAAFFVDKYDRKKVLLFAYIGFLIGTISCGVAPDAVFLMAARIFTGLFGGLIGTQILSIVADTFEYEKRGRAMGVIFTAFSVSSIFGVPFSLYLAKLISWHAPFLFIGIVGIVIIPMIIRFLPAMNKHLQQQSEEKISPVEVLQELGKNKSQLLALTLSGFLMMGHFLIIPFINPYMEFNVGFTKDQTPLIYLVGGTFSFMASFIIGRMADKHGKLKIYLYCAAASLLPIFLITSMPAIPFYFVLCVFAVWFALSTGRTIPAQAMISTVVNPEKRGLFMSFNASVQQLFTGLAALIAGAIVAKQSDGKIMYYNWVGYLSVVIIFCTLFIAVKLAKRQGLK
jgi:MFS transporter, DHA1 family, inner membrane transport protein